MANPAPETRFELRGVEGYQNIARGFTKTKLVFSIADAGHRFAAWYGFFERGLPVVDKNIDVAVVTHGAPVKNIQFGAGNIDPSPLIVSRPRRVDAFTDIGVGIGTGTHATTARIVDSTITVVDDKTDLKRIDIRMSFDLMTGTARETVFSSLRMLCLERPQHNIHPALGALRLLKVETFAKSTLFHIGAFDDFVKNPL